MAKKAFEMPLRQIVSNAGEEASVIISKVAEGKDSFGFNAANNEYGDMIGVGILDQQSYKNSSPSRWICLLG